jgi:hypothetical protein
MACHHWISVTAWAGVAKAKKWKLPGPDSLQADLATCHQWFSQKAVIIFAR